MAITLVNPEALPKVPEFHHQVAIATGSKMVFMAGQVAWDADQKLVGEGDLAAQVEQCYLNVAGAVSHAGGTFKDNVAKLNIYIAGWSIEKFPLFEDGRNRAFAKLGVTAPFAPATVVGVQALFTADLLVEIEAIAILD